MTQIQLEERVEELEIGLMVISSCINNGYIKTARNEIDRLLNTRKAVSAATETAQTKEHHSVHGA